MRSTHLYRLIQQSKSLLWQEAWEWSTAAAKYFIDQTEAIYWGLSYACELEIDIDCTRFSCPMCKSGRQGGRKVRREEFAGTAVSFSDSTSQRSSPTTTKTRCTSAVAGSADGRTARPINRLSRTATRRPVTDQTDTLGISADNCFGELGIDARGVAIIRKLLKCLATEDVPRTLH